MFFKIGEGDYFGMEFGYDRDVTTGNPVPLHNGMISSVAWSNALDTVAQRAYKYAYDDSYRLLSATHYEKNSGWMQAERFTESQLYDDNGNITTLTRKEGQGADLDVLNYTYDGNRLMTVADSGDVAKGFKDGNVTGDDYAYDANGNLVKDRNLGIDTIYYYHSNHPDSLVFANHLRRALRYYEGHLAAAIALIQSRMAVTKNVREEVDILQIAIRCSKDYLLERNKSFVETDILDFDVFLMGSIFGLNRRDHDHLEQLFFKVK